jgi:hypothetical protein
MGERVLLDQALSNIMKHFIFFNICILILLFPKLIEAQSGNNSYNNSDQIRYEELFQLIGRKIDDSIFDNIWNKLGIDSTVDIFNTEFLPEKCFYISYNNDGLEFRFGQDSLLSTIFIKNSYKGELPNNFKFTDSKKKILRKFGKPTKSEILNPALNYSYIYYSDEYAFFNFAKNKIYMFCVCKD